MLYGHICYWVDGEMIGNWDQLASLNDANWDLSKIVCENGRRQDFTLFSEAADVAFNKIDKLIYGVNDEDGDGQLEDPTRFEILPNIPTFNSWKMFSICFNKVARVIYKSDINKLKSLELTEMEIDIVLNSAHDFINKLHIETNVRNSEA